MLCPALDELDGLEVRSFNSSTYSHQTPSALQSCPLR